MVEKSDQVYPCEWRITTGDAETLYAGYDSSSILGDLFAMWTQDQGDVSDWQDADRFGAIIVKYSDLTLPTVAVLLGIEQTNILSVDVPTRGPPWKIVAPDGTRLTIERKQV